MAQAMGLNEYDQMRLITALFHDIGKVGTRLMKILFKAGSFG
ncbi:MAG: hypothetical protein R2827_02965 [Bdellovibrionales bacterium]